MAGHLLLVVLMYLFSEMKAQALLPPKLTVNPPVIAETDSVTLNCQTPSSASFTPCYFHFVREGPGKSFSCLQTLTGTELLKMSNQRSPAEVKVTCFYLLMSPSPNSDVSSIIIRTSLPPKLTVNPPVITETDSVTLNCQTPSSASVTLCSFYTLSGGTVRVLSCLQTLTGTELLKMSQQRSPAEVQVTCFYTVKLGAKHFPSPHSDTCSITIHNIVEKESRLIQVMPNILLTTGQTVGMPSDTGSSASTLVTSVNSATGITLTAEGSLTSADKTLLNPVSVYEIAVKEKITLMIGGVVTVGVVLLGLVIILTQCMIAKCVSKRPNGLQFGYDETYSIVTYCMDATLHDTSHTSWKPTEPAEVQ